MVLATPEAVLVVPMLGVVLVPDIPGAVLVLAILEATQVLAIPGVVLAVPILEATLVLVILEVVLVLAILKAEEVLAILAVMALPIPSLNLSSIHLPMYKLVAMASSHHVSTPPAFQNPKVAALSLVSLPNR